MANVLLYTLKHYAYKVYFIYSTKSFFILEYKNVL